MPYEVLGPSTSFKSPHRLKAVGLLKIYKEKADKSNVSE